MAQASPPDPLVGQILADRYEILNRIGEGGIGVVYKARQIAVDRQVAVKVLGAHVSSDPSWVRRFHNEARAAARLESPNTVRLIESGETKEGLLYIAMEFLNGRSLAAEIARLGRIPPVRVLRILSQVCESLQEAHEKGIIHRDIKPDNIFLLETKGPGGGDFVKVLDFSVAKIESADAQATRVGTVFGTPPYMSPEQGSASKLTLHSDLYSCGIVAYEMLTGKPPFEARVPMEVLMMHMRNQPPPLIGFPQPVVDLVMKALEKQPTKRQTSAADLQRECQEAAALLLRGAVEGPASTGNTGGVPVVAAPPVAAPPVASASGARPPAYAQGAPPTYVPPAQGQYNPPPQQPQQGQGVYDRPQVAQGGPSAGDQGRTLIAQPLPGADGRGGPDYGNRTVSVSAPNLGNAADGLGVGTVFLPAMPISAESMALRQKILAPRPTAAAPAGPLFYVGWLLLGLSVGLLLHFLSVREVKAERQVPAAALALR